MMNSLITQQTALKYDAEVLNEGRVELQVPFSPGARITVFIIKEPADTYNDMLLAAESSLGFWDNPYDDDEWNDA